MSEIANFNLLHCRLKGSNLIEASAGTGKTYAITGLYLRLILEKKMSVEEILVVTFTEAATGELKERLRGRLREAARAVSSGTSDDTFLKSFINNLEDTGEALALLKRSLRDFDEAAVFTIHGFCHKMLQENAFESGNLFDAELVTKQNTLTKEISEDFWRTHFYEGSRMFTEYCISRNITPDSISGLLDVMPLSGARIIPSVEDQESVAEENDFTDVFNRLRISWPGYRHEVEHVLTDDPGLNRSKYKINNIPAYLEEMDVYLKSSNPNPVLPENILKFTSGYIRTSVKKNYNAPCHHFFDECEELVRKYEVLKKIFEKRIIHLKIKFIDYSLIEQKKRKQEQNVLFFDDLLMNLLSALEKNQNGLADRIRSRFKAALIDEFQDTDPVQYDIFKRLFHGKDNILFLIGDPKQSIYGFRGADIFTYMTASKETDARHTLSENWRSENRLVHAVNTVFNGKKIPFLYDFIPFHNVSPPKDKQNESPLILDNMPGSCLKFLFMTREEGDGKPINKNMGRQLATQAVSSRISELLEKGRKGLALLGDRPLKEKDIAVIVRTNFEASMIQKALRVYRIPSVLHSMDNLFTSHEALELERVLTGIAFTNSEKKLKAALSTDIFGLDGESLYNLDKDEKAMEGWMVKFKGYHGLWIRHGFMRMFRELIAVESVLERLILFDNCERRSTNLFHLLEVLHGFDMEKKPGVSGLLKFLSQQRSNPITIEEHQLRLESDENAVNIITVHKSKGLEYPVVFCPFSWTGVKKPKSGDPVFFHDPLADMEPVIDAGSNELDKNTATAFREQLAEDIRLLYVALTRAKNLCYLVAGHIRDTDISAPSYLFDSSEQIEQETIGGELPRYETTTSCDQLTHDIQRIIDRAGGCIQLEDMNPEHAFISPVLNVGEDLLTCRELQARIDRSFTVTSFSSLAAGHSFNYETARDELPFLETVKTGNIEVPVFKEFYEDIFSFPRGTKSGTFMHDIMEHLDFTFKDETSLRDLVKSKLDEYGFTKAWLDTVYAMIKKVISVPLESGQKNFTLSRIPISQRLNELEFYFPLKSISPKTLVDIFSDTGIAINSGLSFLNTNRLEFAPVRGFMKGFMDLVFQFDGRYYILDWKSNHLGAHIEDYGQESLCMAMVENMYTLQYYIYVTALHQYLKVRMPEYCYEKHFGGVFYVFMRGVDPVKGSDYGIFRDRPDVNMIERLCDELIDKK